MYEQLYQLIKNNSDIPKSNLELYEVKKDGNCFYRVLSLYLTQDQNNHDVIRKLIYQATKENKNNLFPFFLNNNSDSERDSIINNMKYENYIEQIKKDGFYAGNVEMGTASILLNLNISIYKLDENKPLHYVHFANIWKDINDINNDIIIILFTGNNHFSLLSFQNNKIKSIKELKEIETKKIKFQKENIEIDNDKYVNKLCTVNNDNEYYENIFNYLASFNLATKKW